MCGVAGLFDIKGSRTFAPALLDAMTTALAHRGPDGAGAMLAPGVALGHRRLAIIDLGGGAQPMSTEDEALTVVFNGEIYNFRDLRAELEDGGAVFRTRSDTEVLLHGWRAWRERMFARLNGMFALAIWDKAAQVLVLARDRFGKKPLHHLTTADGTFAFASEIKALRCVPGFDAAHDPQAVEDFFAYGYIPDPKTIYRQVRRLPPSHYMLIRRGQAPVLRRYWSVLDTLGRGPAGPGALLEELEGAVARRLVSDVPLGALLSGGVDSSAVVALMARRTSEPVRAFSIGFREAEADESGYAREVAQRYRARQQLRIVDPDDVSALDGLAAVFDEPFGDISAVPTLAVCRLARTGVTVALSGDGGDEALAGYRRYAFHLLGEQVRGRLPAPFRRAVLGPLAELYPRGSWLPRPLRARTTLKELSLDPASAYVRMVQALPVETRRSLLSPDFAAGLAGYDSGEVVRSAYQVDAPLDPLQRAQYADLSTYLPGDILTKTDRASMACSLELRSPMLDPGFYAASFNLPPELKITRRAGGKAILKTALEPHLPREVLYRRKSGFTLPVADWFRGKLRPRVLGLADLAILRDSGLFDMAQVRRLAGDHVAGRADNAKALWLVWTFAAFLQHEAASRPARRPAAYA